jgi:hypothetical protein
MDDNSEKIYVSFDYNNVIIVDPNKVIDGNDKVKDRYVKQENLVIYANLECSVLPRTRLAVGTPDVESIQTIRVADINFLNPGKNEYLNNEYTNEITGQDTLKQEGQNQIKTTIQNKNSKTSYINQSIINQRDNGLLGITSIQVRQSTDFTPQITIQLEDIKGRALFESGENSPYGSFFHLPYPPFYLTLKGYYGKAVRLTLMLSKFNARYDSISGNFKIQLDFYTYKYSVLVETPMAHLLAAPYMYPRNYTLEGNSGTIITRSRNTTKELGRQYLEQVYTEYEANKLIPPNFPRLTLVDFHEVLARFLKDTLNSFIQTKTQPLTDVDTYQRDLGRYEGEVYAFGLDSTKKTGSWFELYIDKLNFYVLKGGQKVYFIKKGPNKLEVEKILENLITEFNDRLNKNPTLGTNGKYQRISKNPLKGNDNIETNISNSITKDTFKYLQPIVFEDVDIQLTFKERRNITNVTKELESALKIQFEKDIKNASYKKQNPITLDFENEVPTMTWWVFDGENRFLSLIAQMKKKSESIKQKIEEDITLSLSELLQENKTIGFVPNIRNVLAIVFANAEAFLRLMEKVHNDSWNKRLDSDRINAIFGNGLSADNLKKPSEKIVYPWPQLVVRNDVDKNVSYELKYPGDITIQKVTKGDDYNIWPEVEFVEQYIDALVNKVTRDTTVSNVSNEVNDVKRISLNANEFPVTNVVYFKTEIVKFFYEIFERLGYVLEYSKLNRAEPSFLVDLINEIETTNIKISLEESIPFDLLEQIKQTTINGASYQEALKQFSNNGVGLSWYYWERGEFNTPYILDKVRTNFAFFTSSQISDFKTKPEIGITEENKTKLVNWLTGNSKHNEVDFTDLYPFTNKTWCETNMPKIKSNFQKRYNTSNTIIYNDNYKTLCNFSDITNVTTNRPIVKSIKKINFYLEFGGLIYEVFFNNKSNEELIKKYEHTTFTIGRLNYSSEYSGNVGTKQIVSILNTPYFINAIQEGVTIDKQKNNVPAYTKAAYLFLNSLPLITGKEKLFNENSETDYIFATFKKYGALHKIPYAWFLKIGSIWHRYKKFVNEGVDILDSVWKDFNYLNNYDPINSLPTTVYTFTAKTGTVNTTTNIILQSASTTNLNINLGFFPKVMDDFSYFYIGRSIIGETNISQSIQQSIDSGLLSITQNTEASFSFNAGVDVDNPNRNIKVNSYYCTISAETNSKYFLPSIGGKQENLTQFECFKDSKTNPKLTLSIIDNSSMYNGSVNCLIDSVPRGFFDNGAVQKPLHSGYLKKIDTETDSPQESFSINPTLNSYSSMEELFSIFETDTLDEFENLFLNFSTSDTKFSTKLAKAGNSNYKFYNFQLLMKNMLKYTSNSDIIEETKSQLDQMYDVIDGFLKEDIFFLNKNPSNFNKKLFYTFSDLELKDKYEWEKYVEKTPNVTPINPSSFITYDSAWKTLQTYVGFSTIEQLSYSNNNSFILDFFKDYNIAFTKENAKLFAPIIKIYTTNKLNQYQENILNPKNIPPTGLKVYESLLSTGSTLTINEFPTYKEAIIKDNNIIIWGPSSYSNEQDNVTIQEIAIGLVYGNTVSATTVLYEEKTEIPLDANSSNNSQGAEVFKTNMSKYLASIESKKRDVINLFWPNLQKAVGKIDIQKKKTNISQLNGDPQTKLELWEMFKSLNDKWIAGNDYTSRTLFEDVMILDRASRNIGEKVLVDIFSLKELIDPTKINTKTDVITFVETILTINNFYVMTLPSYINFYGVQRVSGNSTPKPEGTFEFANTLFGTFLNVDYSESSTKMVCQFIDRPSEYVDLSENETFRFGTDIFDLESPANNPTIEDQQDKTDFDKSNKVVGFNVEIGTQNQQIFKNFSVAQNSGLATSEALEILNQMANQGGGRNIATQNMSLYTLYKNRSYTCNISMMGNALIQPTMYFNLKYVPMFYGPYMITEVNHSISQGEFNTDIVGVRQPLASLPVLDNFLQGLRTNLIKEVNEVIQTNFKSNPTSKPTNIISESSYLGTTGNQGTPDATSCKITVSEYTGLEFSGDTIESTSLAFTSMKNIILDTIQTSVGTNDKLAKTIFSYFYYQSGTNDNFSTYSHNYGYVDLLQYWGANSIYFTISNTYFCNTIGNISKDLNTSTATTTTTPMAVFLTPESHAKFFVEWWKLRTNNVDISNIDKATETITSFIIKNKNFSKQETDQFVENLKKNSKDVYDKIFNKVKKAIEIYDRS